MKILLLSDLNSIHTKKWVKAISLEGIELFVFGLTPAKDEFYENFSNVQTGSANQENLRSRSLFSKLSYLKQVKKIKELYSSFKPDLVHAHYASSYGLLGSYLKHKPYLISMWGTDIFEFPKQSILNRILLRRNLRRADFLFSTSHSMAKEAKLYTNKEIRIVPFGVDVSLFSPCVSQIKNEFVIGIVKTLELNYGINFLIEAFSILNKEFNERNIKLIIAGSGSQEEALKNQVKLLRLSDKVEFRGYIPNVEVPACFNEMDVAVISSLEESFGVAAVEAGACGIPVVATAVGGLPEVVIDGRTGLICEPANPKDLSIKLTKLLLDDQLRKTLGQNARNHVLENYNWNQNSSLMVSHYNSIYNSRT